MSSSSHRTHRKSRLRRVRPRLEGLEARALLAVSPVDPGFNGGQAITTSPDTDTGQNTADAVAVQQDDKVVVAGTIATDTNNSPTSTLAVRRYNPDGSVDATFGNNGEADVPLSIPPGDLVRAASNVLIQDDGKIVLAGDLLKVVPTSPDATFSDVGTLVVRLNTDGRLDPTFGTGGVATITTDSAVFSRLALQPDGKVVLAGYATPAGSTQASLFAATRLDLDGSVDPTFNGGNLATLDAATHGGSGVAGVFVSPGGAIVLALGGGVAEWNADGSVATSFGTAGTGFVPNAGGRFNTAAALQPDGKIVLGGSRPQTNIDLTRLDADGTVDPTFAAPAATPTSSDKPLVLGAPASLLVLPDGRIVAGGNLRSTDYGVERFTAAGSPDTTFGVAGIANLGTGGNITGLARASNGEVVAVGTTTFYYGGYHGGFIIPHSETYRLYVARLRDTTLASGMNGDYDGDNISDVAAQLVDGYFATRNYYLQDTLTPFGATGVGAMIPVSGDFDGDGKADVAGYIVSTGTFAYRPSSGGPDVYYQFGSAGAGNSIPSVGDFDGDGKTDMAVYLPAYGGFAIHPSDGSANYLVPFGSAGAGNSIPAVGDYNGDGKSDLAVYLPAYGGFAVHVTGSDTTIGGFGNYLVPFGPAGAGAAIPAPGDYNGDGMTDYAVYLPAYGEFAIEPYRSGSGGGLPYFVPFGMPGAGNTIPAPGDYDGDGITDVAAYLPKLGLFAFRRSAGDGPDALEPFGGGGSGSTIPATSIPYAQGATVSGMALGSDPLAASAYDDVPLTPDVLADIAGAKRKTGS